MTWSLRWKRLGISAFVLVHLSALAVWNIPESEIRRRLLTCATHYVYPLGLWQNWSMFAPDPVRHTITLEASVVDSKGLIYTFAFPKMADFTLAQRIPRVRHGKFVAYFLGEEFKANREIAARHVVRQLKIPEEHFPVELELQYQVLESPPPGRAPHDVVAAKTHPIQSYRFPTWEDVQP